LLGARRARLGIAGLRLGLVGRLHLLDILQRQLQLVDGECLGPSAEPVALKFLDDLAQSFGFRGVGRALGDQHRLERHGVIRKGLGQGRHRRGLEHIYKRLRRPHEAPESTCRRLKKPQCAASGTRVRRLSWTRRQSSPSNRADSCAPLNRIVPSWILGQRN